jgi:hypothetical protein
VDAPRYVDNGAARNGESGNCRELDGLGLDFRQYSLYSGFMVTKRRADGTSTCDTLILKRISVLLAGEFPPLTRSTERPISNGRKVRLKISCVRVEPETMSRRAPGKVLIFQPSGHICLSGICQKDLLLCLCRGNLYMIQGMTDNGPNVLLIQARWSLDT